MLKFDIEYLYNGYKFHPEATNKLYNSAMINYFFSEIIDEGLKVERLIDDNIKTDYGRIKMFLKNPGNIEKLEKIIEKNSVVSKVIARFSIDKLHESDNFLSLLYYMGLVTIDKDEKTGRPLLKIPNYSIKTIYWEYLQNIILERNPKMVYDSTVIYDGLSSMAFENDYNQFFENFQKNFVSQISIKDLRNFSEKNVKFMLLSILFQTNYYLPIPELENSQGFTDIYLQRRNNLYPKITTDWIWELKYVKQTDSENQKLIETKKEKSKEQLLRYKSSNLFKDRKDVRYLSIVFIGKKKYWIEEV
jgi:hypothetical protein